MGSTFGHTLGRRPLARLQRLQLRVRLRQHACQPIRRAGSGGSQEGIYRSSRDARCVVQYVRGTNVQSTLDVQNASYQRCEHPGSGGGQEGLTDDLLLPAGHVHDGQEG
eukprot:987201-Prorocentrum_minimum.AAC.1